MENVTTIEQAALAKECQAVQDRHTTANTMFLSKQFMSPEYSCRNFSPWSPSVEWPMSLNNRYSRPDGQLDPQYEGRNNCVGQRGGGGAGWTATGKNI